MRIFDTTSRVGLSFSSPLPSHSLGYEYLTKEPVPKWRLDASQLQIYESGLSHQLVIPQGGGPLRLVQRFLTSQELQDNHALCETMMKATKDCILEDSLF